MKFKMNNSEWEIKEISKDYLIDRYNKEHEQPCYYAFGLTDYPQHIIYLNDEMCKEQKRKTLMHELTHCYLWEYGVCDFTQFTEEDVCNFNAGSHDIIHKIVEEYFKELEIEDVESKYSCKSTTQILKEICDDRRKYGKR